MLPVWPSHHQAATLGFPGCTGQKVSIVFHAVGVMYVLYVYQAPRAGLEGGRWRQPI